LENPIPSQNEPPVPRPRSGMISLVLALTGAAVFFASLITDAPEILPVIAFLLLLVALIYGGRSLFKREGRTHGAWAWLGLLLELLLIGVVAVTSFNILMQTLVWVVGAAVLSALIYVFGSFFA